MCPIAIRELRSGVCHLQSQVRALSKGVVGSYKWSKQGQCGLSHVLLLYIAMGSLRVWNIGEAMTLGLDWNFLR